MKKDEQVLKNLDLAESLLQDLLDVPSLIDEIPAGSTVVLVPDDDADLAQANLQAAEALVRRQSEDRQSGLPGSPGRTRRRGQGVYLKPA